MMATADKRALLVVDIINPLDFPGGAQLLEVLLRQLRVEHVVVTGIAGDGCVLSTATDAHMRDLGVSVPSDCCASITAVRNRQALALLRQSLKLDTRASRHL